jgi:prevent-host-death family protein
MATRIGVRELRQNLSRALERVRRGETLEVTRNGQPLARIVPVSYPTKLDQLIAEGKARPALRPMDLTRPLPKATGPMTASEALQEDRGD